MANQWIDDVGDFEKKFTSLESNEIVNKTIPVYDNHTRIPNEPNMVYSSTMNILKGLKNYVEVAAKNYYDKSLQSVILSVATDEYTDFLTLRQREKNESQILLPAIALSLSTYKFLYAPSNNIERFAQYFYTGSNQLSTYIAIPTEFKLSLRYYTTNYDLLVRFSENLCFNSQLATKGRFYYDVLDNEGKVQKVEGFMVIDADNSNHTPKQLSLKDKRLGSVWSLSIPVYAWAAIVSKPFDTRSVTAPQVNIHVEPEAKSSIKTQLYKYVNLYQEE